MKVFDTLVIGSKYNFLTLIKKLNYPYAIFKCECGEEKPIIFSNVIHNRTRSCGCLQKKWIVKKNSELKTGFCEASNTKEGKIRSGMLYRCYNKNHEAYKDYGGRGITVCERWKNSLKNFLEDMGECPPGKTLERINNNGNYEPSNCRWATKVEQQNNKRNSKYLEYNGIKQTQAQWERVLGFPKNLILQRLTRGWSLEKTLTVGYYGKNYRNPQMDK